MNLDDPSGKVTVGHWKVDCRLRNEGFSEREREVRFFLLSFSHYDKEAYMHSVFLVEKHKHST